MTRGQLRKRAFVARVQHRQWVGAASRGGACGIHQAECLRLAAEARRTLAETLRALRVVERESKERRRAA